MSISSPPPGYSNLPIEALREDIFRALQQSNRLIIEAPTGCGKSTKVPQMLLESDLLGSGKIMILQPRRLAARLLAARVAHERQSSLGEEVGYCIRHDTRCGASTRLLFVTEGILLRQILTNPSLQGVGALLFDEFHERHLYSDISLMQALEVQQTSRPDLKIVIMSATLETSALADYLEPCELLRSSTRSHPVTIEYLEKCREEEKIWDLATQGVEKALRCTSGHLLVFMPGAYEISRTITTLRAQLPSSITILPLHGELSTEEQDAALSKSEGRKIIVATNVAETSLTIDGVEGVIDSGLARIARFDSRRRMNTLLIEKISRASADQRAGRAGRTAPGYCLRLWSEREQMRRPLRQTPEIQRVDLSEVLLILKAMDFSQRETIPWLDRPQEDAIQQSTQLLHDLGALDHDGKITSLGREMLSFPVHPRYARMLLAAEQFGCVRQVALMAALTQSRPLLLRTDRRTEEKRRDLFEGGDSDFLVLFGVFSWAKRHGFRAEACRQYAIHAPAARETNQIFEQLCSLAKTQGLSLESSSTSDEGLIKSLLLGFADQVARRRNMGTNLADMVHGRRGLLIKNSAAAASRLFVAAQITEIGEESGDLRTQFSLASALDEKILRELFPNDVEEKRLLFFDTTLHRLFWKEEKIYRDLVIESICREATPSLEASRTLALALLENNLPLPSWEAHLDPWLERLGWLSHFYPQWQWPRWSEEHHQNILELWCAGATAYREVKDRPLLPLLKRLFTPAQERAFEQLAPASYQLPSGRSTLLHYQSSGKVTLRATIQDLFGLLNTPRLADGRVAITFEILAPNKRLLQITDDLNSFWRETYPKIKIELAPRYPKHRWK